MTEAIAKSIKFITNVDPQIIARLCILDFGSRIGGATSYLSVGCSVSF